VPSEDQSTEDRVRERSLEELPKEVANGSLSRGQALKWVGVALLGGVLASILIPALMALMTAMTTMGS